MLNPKVIGLCNDTKRLQRKRIRRLQKGAGIYRCIQGCRGLFVNCDWFLRISQYCTLAT